MLILTRRPLETIVIVLPEGTKLEDGTVLRGDDCLVRVTVLGVIGNHVRAGIKAYKKIPIHREEIYEAIKSEQAAGRDCKMLLSEQR